MIVDRTENEEYEVNEVDKEYLSHHPFLDRLNVIIVESGYTQVEGLAHRTQTERPSCSECIGKTCL